LSFSSYIYTSDLTTIAKQGVLWLNTCLTVRAHKAGSHAKKGWETFTAQVVRAVLKREDPSGVVIMAWGLPAQKTFASIGINAGKHLLLKLVAFGDFTRVFFSSKVADLLILPRYRPTKASLEMDTSERPTNGSPKNMARMQKSIGARYLPSDITVADK